MLQYQSSFPALTYAAIPIFLSGKHLCCTSYVPFRDERLLQFPSSFPARTYAAIPI
jgi:hypothetical protein